MIFYYEIWGYNSIDYDIIVSEGSEGGRKGLRGCERVWESVYQDIVYYSIYSDNSLSYYGFRVWRGWEGVWVSEYLFLGCFWIYQHIIDRILWYRTDIMIQRVSDGIIGSKKGWEGVNICVLRYRILQDI